MKNIHLSRASRDYPHPSSLQRTSMYASFLRISGALHLGRQSAHKPRLIKRGEGAQSKMMIHPREALPGGMELHIFAQPLKIFFSNILGLEHLNHSAIDDAI